MDVIGTERTRAWWNAMGRYQLAPDFVQTVDSLLEGKPLTDQHEKLLAWK